LAAWERGLSQRPFEQALTLLSAACPDETTSELAVLSIGQRDVRLLRLRAWVFGERLSSISRCPQCAETLEFEFNVSDILVEDEPPATLSLEVDGYSVEFRLPNSADLTAIAEANGQASARLLERCILSLSRAGIPIAVSALPAAVMNAITDCMAQADPQTDVQLDLTCPACGQNWHAPFDIVSYFWSEVNVWAGRLLSEVHTLAFTYGWDEADILAMSSTRRKRYLEMIQA
jgi:hypothetical protein